MSGDCLYTVLPFIASILSLSSTSLTDQVLSYGIWTYMLIFIVIGGDSWVISGFARSYDVIGLTEMPKGAV